MLDKEYEVQIHFENGGSFNFKKKFSEDEDADDWIEDNFGGSACNSYVRTDDGRSILVNMVKVLAVVLINLPLQQEIQNAPSEV